MRSATYRNVAPRKGTSGLVPSCPEGSVGGHCVYGGAHMAPILPGAREYGVLHPTAVSFLQFGGFEHFQETPGLPAAQHQELIS